MSDEALPSKAPFLTAGIIYAGQSSEALPLFNRWKVHLFRPKRFISAAQPEALPAQRPFGTAPGATRFGLIGRWSAVAFFLGLLESKRFGLGHRLGWGGWD